MAVRARVRSDEAGSFDLEYFRLADVEERAVAEVFDDRREMEFFVIPDCPDRVTAARLEVVLPVNLADRDRDVDLNVCVEEKFFPTFRIFDLAKTLDAF